MDTSAVINGAQLIAQYRNDMLLSLNNAKRRLTAQFNDSKRKEDEEKTRYIDAIAALYGDLVDLTASIEQQKKERRLLADTNKKREQLAYSASFDELVDAVKKAHQLQCEDRRKILEGMTIDLDELLTVLRSKQSAQLASLNPPRELTRQILVQTHAIERFVAETDAQCRILTAVIDVEKKHFEAIIAAEASDRDQIFYREEARLLAEKKVAEDKLKALNTLMNNEKAEKELNIAQLILQQRQFQGDAEVYLHEIKQLELAYDQHEKAVAERRFKKTAAYKFQLVQGALTTNLLNPLKHVATAATNAAIATTEAIIPKHEPPPSSVELEKRSEERRQLRDQCTAYINGLKHAIEQVKSETEWKEEQTEMVKAMLHNDELGLEQLSARIREILQRRKPDYDGDEEEGEEISGTFNRTVTSRRSVSSARSTNFSSF